MSRPCVALRLVHAVVLSAGMERILFYIFLLEWPSLNFGSPVVGGVLRTMRV